MESAIASITVSISDLIDRIFSLFSALCSNGLFIALASAWFTSQIQSLRTSFKEYIKTLEKRIFFIRSCIFLVEQNYSWLKAVTNSNFPINTVISQIKRIELLEFSYQAPIDKMAIRILSMYEEGLTTALAGLHLSPTAKKKNTFLKSLENQSQLVIKCLETCIEVYENSLNNPYESFLFRFKSLSEEQANLQKKLEELAQEGHSANFLRKE